MTQIRNFPLPLVALLLVSGSAPAFAANCGTTGNLFFLGDTSNASNSVWLSNTSAGSFRLDAAQGNTTVDTWMKTSPGLNVSISPFVSNGNGGTHKLYDNSGNGNCLLDTQNQKGGITLPPHVLLPPTKLPGIAVPPIGHLFPHFLTPMLPGGVKPPIGTLPPGYGTIGVTPGMPGGVRPPIGTLPPGYGTVPVTPTVPGGITPPIGTLPPATGITPGMPGGVTPPIGTLPPATGITPGMPGGVTPPSAPCRPPPASLPVCQEASHRPSAPCRPPPASLPVCQEASHRPSALCRLPPASLPACLGA